MEKWFTIKRMQLKRDVQCDAEGCGRLYYTDISTTSGVYQGIRILDIGHMSEKAPCPEVKLLRTRSPLEKFIPFHCYLASRILVLAFLPELLV